jgi:hypothetical protein
LESAYGEHSGVAADNLIIAEHSDWERFVQRLNDLVQNGRVRRIAPMKSLKANDEEWYLDPETGEVYVYEPPDWPFLPSWQRVDVLGSDHVTMPSRPAQ